MPRRYLTIKNALHNEKYLRSLEYTKKLEKDWIKYGLLEED